MHNQTPGNANQLTWKQERKLLNRLLGREQVSLRCGPKRQGNGLESLSQTQNWRCWCLPTCCCGLHFQCLICSPHVGSKLIHEFCSSGVELLPVRKTQNRKGGGIFMDFVSLRGANISSDFFFPHNPAVIILWYLLSLEWVGACCVHMRMSWASFNSSMSESHRAHCALTQTLCSTDVGFRSTKIKTALCTSETTLNTLGLEKNSNLHRQHKQSSI